MIFEVVSGGRYSPKKRAKDEPPNLNYLRFILLIHSSSVRSNPIPLLS